MIAIVASVIVCAGPEATDGIPDLLGHWLIRKLFMLIR
jgi:hypothetical protein